MKVCVFWYSISVWVLYIDDRIYMCSSYIDDFFVCVLNNEMFEDIWYIYILVCKEYYFFLWVVYDVDSKYLSGRCDGNLYMFWFFF